MTRRKNATIFGIRWGDGPHATTAADRRGKKTMKKFTQISDNLIVATRKAPKVIEEIKREKRAVAREAAQGKVPISCGHLIGKARQYSSWYRDAVRDFQEKIGADYCTVKTARSLTGVTIEGPPQRKVWVVA